MSWHGLYMSKNKIENTWYKWLLWTLLFNKHAFFFYFSYAIIPAHDKCVLYARCSGNNLVEAIGSTLYYNKCNLKFENFNLKKKKLSHPRQHYWKQLNDVSYLFMLNHNSV